MQKSIIEWVKLKNSKPEEYGWYLVLLKPENYKELKSNGISIDKWVSRFGLNKLWYNDFKFWNDHSDITDRVIFWAKIPTVPSIENNEGCEK